MRVFFISSMHAEPWGGSEELWARAALRLARSGHSVAASVVGWPEVHPRVKELMDAGVEVVFRRSRPRSLRQQLRSRLKSMLFAEATDPVDLFTPDVAIMSVACILEAVWGNALAQKQIPYGILVQAAHEFHWPNDRIQPGLRAGYTGARRVFFVSHRNRVLTEDQLACALPAAEVVRNPFNVPFDVQVSWPATDTWKLAFVARLSPLDKGHDLLFRVLSQRKWAERNVEVNLYGGGPFSEATKRLAARFSLPRVHFAGYTSDVRQVWNEHHGLIMPSRAEGLPLALVEAMLCSRMAIVTDVAGNCELIEDHVNGFVAAAPTVGLIDDALERAWTHREEWRRMGEAARAAAVRLVPPDPVGDFCSRILTIASGAQVPQDPVQECGAAAQV